VLYITDLLLKLEIEERYRSARGIAYLNWRGKRLTNSPTQVVLDILTPENGAMAVYCLPLVREGPLS